MTPTQMEQTLQALGKTIDALVQGVAQSKANSDRYIWLKDKATSAELAEFINSLRQHRNAYVDDLRNLK